MGQFAGADKAKVSARGSYFSPGFSGVVRPTKITMVASQQSGDLYTVEFLVKETNNTQDPAGSTRTYQIGMRKKETAFGNIKAFLGATQGMTEPDQMTREIGEAEMEASIDETLNDIYMERDLLLDAVLVSTKEDKAKDKALGNPPGTTKSFTVHNFKPLEVAE